MMFLLTYQFLTRPVHARYCKILFYWRIFHERNSTVLQIPQTRTVDAPVIGFFLYKTRLLEVLGMQYKIFYVDSDNLSTVDKISPIKKKFMTLPTQAIVELQGRTISAIISISRAVLADSSRKIRRSTSTPSVQQRMSVTPKNRITSTPPYRMQMTPKYRTLENLVCSSPATTQAKTSARPWSRTDWPYRPYPF